MPGCIAAHSRDAQVGGSCRLRLADEAQVGIVTVRQLEFGQNQPRRATLIVVRLTLEDAGVEFIDENGGGVGVRLRERRRGGRNP